MTKPDRDDEPTPHELFLPEREGDPPVVPVFLSISRERPIVENAGAVLEPHELPDLEAIRNRYGPGTYLVRARDAKKRVIAARRIVVSGRGVPMSMDGSGEPLAGYGLTHGPSGQPMPVPPPPAPQKDDTMAMLLAFMKDAEASRAAQFQSMMAAERERSNTMVQTLTTTFQQTFTALAEVSKVARESSGGTGNGQEGFMAGVAYAQEIQNALQGAAGAAADSGGDDTVEILKSIATVAQGFGIGSGGGAPSPPTGDGA